VGAIGFELSTKCNFNNLQGHDDTKDHGKRCRACEQSANGAQNSTSRPLLGGGNPKRNAYGSIHADAP
jgi:hypothetical protein